MINSIFESSLSRIWRHSENHDVAMLTAFRGKMINCVGGTKLDDNKEKNNELKATLLKLGYGVTAVTGVYQEEGQSADKEASYFVVNLKDSKNFINDIIKLGIYYCQDSVFIKPLGEEPYLYGTNHSKDIGFKKTVYIKDINPDRKGNETVFRAKPKKGTELFYSTIKNKAFAWASKPNVEESLDSFEYLETFENLQVMTKALVHNRAKNALEYLKNTL